MIILGKKKIRTTRIYSICVVSLLGLHDEARDKFISLNCMQRQLVIVFRRNICVRRAFYDIAILLK